MKPGPASWTSRVGSRTRRGGGCDRITPPPTRRTVHAPPRPAPFANLSGHDAPRRLADRRQLRPRPVAGRPAALPGRGRRPDERHGQVGPAVLALGRAVAARHLGPQAQRPARIPRAVRRHRHRDHRRPHLRVVSEDRQAQRSLRHPAVAAHRLQRSRRGRHHRPDRQRRRRRRPRRQAAARRAAADHRQRRGAGARRRRETAAVHRGRRPAAPGQEGHRRRGRRRRSAACTIPSVWNTTRSTARAFPPCNCRPTSRRNGSTTASACWRRSTRLERRTDAGPRRAGHRRLPRPGVRHADLAGRPQDVRPRPGEAGAARTATAGRASASRACWPGG